MKDHMNASKFKNNVGVCEGSYEYDEFPHRHPHTPSILHGHIQMTPILPCNQPSELTPPPTSSKRCKHRSFVSRWTWSTILSSYVVTMVIFFESTKRTLLGLEVVGVNCCGALLWMISMWGERSRPSILGYSMLVVASSRAWLLGRW